MVWTVTMVNFKKYVNVTITFPNSGLIQVDGETGSGKTTIFNAIEWVLFHKGSDISTRNSAMKAKKSTKVTLKNDSIKIQITRSNTPGRLVVTFDGEKYVDNAGQHVIESLFGTYEVWKSSSYLSHKSHNYFIDAPKDVKEDIVRKMSIRTQDPTEIVEYIKKTLKWVKVQQNETATILKERTKTYNKDYDENSELYIHTPDEELAAIKADISASAIIIKDLEKQRDKYVVWRHKRTTLSANIKAYKQDLLKLKEYDTIPENADVVIQIKKEIERIKKELSGIEEIDKDLPHYTMDDYVNAKQHSVKYTTQQQQYKKLNATNRDDLKAKYEKSLEYKKQKVYYDATVKFRSIQAQLDSKDKEMAKFTEEDVMQADSNKDTGLDVELKNLTKEYQHQLAEINKIAVPKAHHCPSCNVELCIKNGNLILYEFENVEERKKTLKDEYEATSKELQQKIAKSKIYVNIRNLRKDVDVLIQSLESNKPHTFVDVLPKLSVVYSESDYPKIEKLLAAEQLSEGEDPEYIKSVLDKMKSNNMALSLHSRLETLTDEYPSLSVKDIESMISTTKQREQILLNIDSENAKLEALVDVADPTKELDDQRQLHSSLKDDLNYFTDCNKIVERLDKEYNKMMDSEEYLVKLDDIALHLNKINSYSIETESETLEEAIAVINHNIEVFCDDFFPGLGSTILISTVKSNKSNKIEKKEINTTIIHNGAQIGKISQVSNGEGDRFSLAFTLAMAEINKSPFVILDESISSIHQELKDDVIESIKEKSFNRPILMVLHDTAEGMFDHVIHVADYIVDGEIAPAGYDDYIEDESSEEEQDGSEDEK